LIAAQNGHSTVTTQLLAVRCNVDLQSSSGVTVLYVAAQNGHVSVTHMLIQARCNMDLQREDG
jgi:ankyrin repeat protein